MRSDAAQNRDSILVAARRLLEQSGHPTLADIAAAAGVSRATVYRHFETREALLASVVEAPTTVHPQQPDEALPVGRLGRRRPVPLEAINVFDAVSPPVLPEQLLAEAQRMAKVPLALYVVDIDGSHLLRVAGTRQLPQLLAAPLAVGPELDKAALEELRDRLVGLRQVELVPLWLRGRANGVLVALGKPAAPLADLARQASAAITLADRYTDTFARAQRRKQPKAAAEMQQSLLPPRIARVSGGEVAGNVVPSYEVAGDWFDVVENLDGVWLTVADGLRSSTRATAAAAVALGAFRAARRSGAGIAEALLVMHTTLKELPGPHAEMTAAAARWDSAAGSASIVNCGHVPPIAIREDGRDEVLGGRPGHGLGGRARPQPEEVSVKLRPGDRLIMVSDGVVGSGDDQAGLGYDRLAAAARRSGTGTAADTVRRIHSAVLESAEHGLDDDATAVCLAVA
jgi:serine phosphatase RsbU (regulator of sigma subunit)